MDAPGHIMMIIAIALAVVSMVLYGYKKDAPAIALLSVGAFILRLFMARLDPFLHDWDERFHALVARNMMGNPFKPFLKPDSLISYDYRFWTENHIWLHKQPLFMWQMALSMRLFGTTEIALRLPSVLMGALMVVFVYRICKIVSGDRLVAYAAALLMCFSNYQLELISGFIGMDHNDVAFGFYVLGSLWAYAESTVDSRKRWIILIGLFAGGAVLNKWLTGLLVFGAWGLNIILFDRKLGLKKEIGRFIVALLVAVIVFAPWQLYILSKFPAEARYEYAYNSQHIFEAIENHSGGPLFYAEKFRQYFGLFTWWLCPIGFAVFLYMRAENNKVKTMLVSSFAIIFCFFSFVVKTKMQSYFFVVGPIGYIFMAYATTALLSKRRLPVAVTAIPVIICAFFLFNYRGIRDFFHSGSDAERQHKLSHTAIYKKLKEHLPANVVYVFNTPENEEVDLMFYNKGLIAYHGKADKTELEKIKQAKLPVAVFRNNGNNKDADFFSGYSQAYFLDGIE